MYPNPSTALAAVVVDELVRAGVGLVSVSPGSRSTAVVLEAARREELSVVVVIDERSAGFHALGWAKTAGRPAAVVTTSGTAAANLYPAIIEADASGTPLVAVTCDRPPEARDAGVNQTIRQPGIYGSFVRDAIELGPAEVDPHAPRWWRSRVAQALSASQGFAARPGPVQLNLAFREPTVPVSDDGRTKSQPYSHVVAGRDDGRPWTEATWDRGVDMATLGRVVAMIETVERGLIIAGGGCMGSEEVLELGRRLGWPVVATAESGLRRLDGVVAAGHHLLASPRAQPDLVLRFGSPGPSRRVVDLISSEVYQVVVAPTWSDPARVADLMIPSGIASTAGALARGISPGRPNEWVRWWQEADRTVRSALSAEMEGPVTEPAVVAALGSFGADRVAVASSMPIRDVEMYGFDCPTVVSNRGASGIDGFVSTALGMAGAAGAPVALTGDLSLLHDVNGFLCEPRPDCVFVVVDNQGGGIFSFLPHVEHAGPDFERLFATPPNRDLARLADWHGLGFQKVEDSGDLVPAVMAARAAGGCRMVVVETDRSENVEVHRRLDVVAARALTADSHLY
ncbi:2-succinyl-5-enolpyruvyl-6-hydroxy-3-cyclohexene-1-carboxylic-acid synthase [soil metagenome]